MNWTRAQLKSNARMMLRQNYWLCVAVSVIVGLVAGGNGLNLNYNLNDGQSYTVNPGDVASNLGGDWVGYLLKIMPFLAVFAGVLIVLSVLFKVLVGNALTVGSARFYLHNIHSKGEFGDLGFAFKNCFGNVVVVMLLRGIFIWLWTLALVIPGIVKSYQYMLVPYLLADDPEMEYREALNTSREMMDGEKMNAFILHLSFIGWEILSAFTGGLLGIFWVNPYKDATGAELYTAIKARWTGRSF